jgi:hypothetical protein
VGGELQNLNTWPAGLSSIAGRDKFSVINVNKGRKGTTFVWE